MMNFTLPFNSTRVIQQVNALSSHQSIILGSLALLLVLVSITYIYKARLTEQQYKTILNLLFIPSFLIGVYATYAAVYLGWNQATDPVPIFLLFLGGACGMSLESKTHPWAWIAAPLVAGYGTYELWGYLAADPNTYTSLGVIVAITMPTFVVMLYIQQFHSSVGLVLVKTRLAFFLAIVMLVQALFLVYGYSLSIPLANAFSNAITKIGGMM